MSEIPTQNSERAKRPATALLTELFCPILNLNFVNQNAIASKQALLSAYRRYANHRLSVAMIPGKINLEPK
ncbi:hypothetical protein FD723_20000 [Nostoc sp. C052]|uniref:hypothetical protein n=1 Tax=Nostoc sp. C052 TaxID=2576902 RepID=UPI0015C39FAB|nr:hypothetical protein [Nostoc sp. C052]QLE42486.1 hypothetical protein FD723_20000 [Nostoc sp. C052]